MSEQMTEPTANQNQPIVDRARLRRAQLEAIAATLPAGETRSREDIQRAIDSANTLLTGDLANLSAATKAELQKWLDANAHVGEAS